MRVLFRRQFAVALCVVLVAGERREPADAREDGVQLVRRRLRDDVYIDGEPADGVQPQEQAGAALELKRQPAFCEMTEYLERDNRLLQHHRIPAAEAFRVL